MQAHQLKARGKFFRRPQA